MGFKRGILVEVLTKKNVPSGVWRCAQIMADNGDEYTVRYCRRPDLFKESVDKVSAKSVRPCPPLENSVVWAVGDVAEVLDAGYWKVSVIEEDLGEKCYQIRVIGSLDEFKVKKSNIRMRQEWKDNKWVSLGKGSENCEDLMMRICKKARMQQEECMQKRRTVIHDDSYSFIGNADSHVNLKEIQSIFDDAMFLAKTSKSNDCGLLRHKSLIAAFIMMMPWLSTSSLVSRKGHHLCWILCR